MHILLIAGVNRPKDPCGCQIHIMGLHNLFKSIDSTIKIDVIHAIDNESKLKKTFRKIKAVLFFILFNEPTKISYLKSMKLIKKVRIAIKKTNYDFCMICHAELLWLVKYVPESTTCIFISQSIDYLLHKQYLDDLRLIGFIKKFFCRDIKLFQNFEIKYVKKIKNCITIALPDTVFYKEAVLDCNIITIPPTFNYMPHEYTFKYKQDQPLRCGFLANMDNWANKDGLEWFLQCVWKFLPSEVELHIYGRETEKLNIHDKNIYCRGFIQNLNNIWKTSDLMICPIFKGSGFNVKVAESIYNGIPILLTSFALKNLTLSYCKNSLFVSNKSEEWIQIVSKIVNGTIQLEQQPEDNKKIFREESYRHLLKDYLNNIQKQNNSVTICQ
jgi:hypothetical protein